MDEFIRRCTEPPNLGWNWKFPVRFDALDTSEVRRIMNENLESDKIQEDPVDEDDEEERGVAGELKVPEATYTQWWDNPLSVVLFESGMLASKFVLIFFQENYLEDPTTEHARDHVENYLKATLQSHVTNMLQTSVLVDQKPPISAYFASKSLRLLSSLKDCKRNTKPELLPFLLKSKKKLVCFTFFSSQRLILLQTSSWPPFHKVPRRR